MSTSPHIVLLDSDRFYHAILRAMLTRYQDELSSYHVQDLRFTSFLHTLDLEHNMHQKMDFVILNYFLDDGKTCQPLMRNLLSQQPNCKIIVISGHMSLRTAISPILMGADDFILKDNHFTNNLQTYLDVQLKSGYQNAS